jgi:hypothetical protein
MEELENDKDCPICNGKGHIEQLIFTEEKGKPPHLRNCYYCNGTAHVPLSYFVEFMFTTDMGNIYYFPLYISGQSIDEVKMIISQIKNALSLKKYSQIQSSTPVLESMMSSEYRIHRERKYQGKQQSILNIQEWRFKDINNPTWSFEDHVQYISNHFPLTDRDIATLEKEYKFPVRVIKDVFPPSDFYEFLLIDVVNVKH